MLVTFGSGLLYPAVEYVKEKLIPIYSSGTIYIYSSGTIYVYIYGSGRINF